MPTAAWHLERAASERENPSSLPHNSARHSTVMLHANQINTTAIQPQNTVMLTANQTNTTAIQPQNSHSLIITDNITTSKRHSTAILLNIPTVMLFANQWTQGRNSHSPQYTHCHAVLHQFGKARHVYLYAVAQLIHIGNPMCFTNEQIWEK